MMHVIYAHEHPTSGDGPTLFLAGPSPRGNEDYNWRPQALEYLENAEFEGMVFVPLPRNGEYHPDYDHDAQVDWELQYLLPAHAVAFWIPRDLVRLPGFTTNVEFGLCASSGRMVLGYPEGAPKMRYLRRVAERFQAPIHHTLSGTLVQAIALAEKNARTHEL